MFWSQKALPSGHVEHSSMSCEQSFPSYPVGQSQLKSFMRSLHSPLTQGPEAHSLISISQFVPSKPAKQWQMKINGYEMVRSQPLNRNIGCLRPTMIRAGCLQVRQHHPAQKNNQKMHVFPKQMHNSGSP